MRTHVATTPTAKNGKGTPYPAGSSFFFKVKFDEPYLMYRDWREVTKTLLSKGPSASNVPKGKLRRPETQAYVRWVCAEIRRDRAQFDGFTKGKGIIATRERFLAWMASAEGKDALAGEGEGANGEEVQGGGGAKEEVDWTKGKVIIVPVAIPGVGECLSSHAGDVCRHRAAAKYVPERETHAEALHVLSRRQDVRRGRAAAPLRVWARPERRHHLQEGRPDLH